MPKIHARPIAFGSSIEKKNRIVVRKNPVPSTSLPVGLGRAGGVVPIGRVREWGVNPEPPVENWPRTGPKSARKGGGAIRIESGGRLALPQAGHRRKREGTDSKASSKAWQLGHR